MTISTSFRTVLTLLAVAALAGLLATACAPACGRLCDSDFWIDENEKSINPSVADVQAEIDGGADVNAPEDGLSPLAYALGRGSPEVVELLLESGADPKADQDMFLCLLIMAGDSIEDVQKMDLMLYHGADVNLECLEGKTPLSWAVMSSGNVPLVETMILYGADVNAQTKGDVTPLMWAAIGRSDRGPFVVRWCTCYYNTAQIPTQGLVRSVHHFTRRSVWAALTPFRRSWNTARDWMLPTVKVRRPASKVGK